MDSSSDPLPVFLVQVGITLALTRTLGKFFRYIKQPQVIGEIIGGILLGPSVLGNIPNYSNYIWPAFSLPTYTVAANIGLILFMFGLGLELDAGLIKRLWGPSAPLAVLVVAFPFGIGIALTPWLYPFNNAQGAPNENRAAFILFCGCSIAFTAFPVLASLLTATKLLDTPLGVLAIVTASMGDVLAWCLLAVSSSFAATGSAANGGYTFLAVAVYVVVMLGLVKPVLEAIRARFFNSKELEKDPLLLMLVFMVLLASSFYCEIIGVHAFFGAFMGGVVVPRGEHTQFAENLHPQLELITKEFLLPLYFASSGIKTNIGAISSGQAWGYTIALIVISVLAKFIPGCLGAKIVAKKDWRFSVTFGVLMNTRGLVELIALNVGLQTGVLSTTLFSMLVIMAVVTTLMTSPLVWLLYQRDYDPTLQDSAHRQLHEVQPFVSEEAFHMNVRNASFTMPLSDAHGEGGPALDNAIPSVEVQSELSSSFKSDSREPIHVGATSTETQAQPLDG